jgi:hypothetical protein
MIGFWSKPISRISRREYNELLRLQCRAALEWNSQIQILFSLGMDSENELRRRCARL